MKTKLLTNINVYLSCVFKMVPGYQRCNIKYLKYKNLKIYVKQSISTISYLILILKQLNLSRYTPRRRLAKKYSFYSLSTSAVDGGEWSASRPGRILTPGKGPPVPVVQEAGWAPEPVWTQRLEEKSFATAGDRTSTALWSSP
jgi:hypothetical protein